MQVKAIVHEDENGGFWAEVPALPGCATQGETMEELLANLREAIEGYLTVEIKEPLATQQDRIMDILL
jgi:predicted RNase H-like HicB family nuclease